MNLERLNTRLEEIESKLLTADDKTELIAECESTIAALKELTRIYTNKVGEWESVIDRHT